MNLDVIRLGLFTTFSNLIPTGGIISLERKLLIMAGTGKDTGETDMGEKVGDQ